MTRAIDPSRGPDDVTVGRGVAYDVTAESAASTRLAGAPGVVANWDTAIPGVGQPDWHVARISRDPSQGGSMKAASRNAYCKNIERWW